MKKLKYVLSMLLSVVVMVMLSAAGTGYAMAEGDPAPEAGFGAPNVDGKNAVPAGGPGAGKVVEGARTLGGDQEVIHDNEWFLKHVNQAIVEMKFCGTPIDQILRNATTNKSDSIVVKYYSVGQRPLRVTLTSALNKTTGAPTGIEIDGNNILGEMDTLLVMDASGHFVVADGQTQPLMLRVHAISAETNKPMVYAVNGEETTAGNPFIIPALEAGTVLLRMGRAAAEKDVSTGSYYQLPEPTEQFCQRFIMEVEESVYSRFSKTELDWTFTRMEKMAMEDMRIGMEATGLFGIKSKHVVNKQGLIYTTEGIWYKAGKDLTIGHWEIVTDSSGKPVKDPDSPGYYKQEYVITENELVDLVADVNEGAGNSSRKKMVFVDKMIYAALCKIKTNNRVRLLDQEKNYMNLGLDFQSYTSMGTTLMFYRHDLFNEWGFEGRAFVLDAEYLDKWVFMDWQREEYDLNKLYIRNSNAVTMQEFSCWTLSFPDAHARVAVPEYVAVAVPEVSETPETPEPDNGSTPAEPGEGNGNSEQGQG